MKARRIRWPLLYVVVGLIAVLALAILNNACVSQILFPISPSKVVPKGFVTRSGSQLLLNGRPFRFAGANIHWLALDDSTTYPSQFRVNDVFDAAQEMGLTVVRSHSL